MDHEAEINAYGVDDIVDVEARDGLVIIEAVMQGGETVKFGLQPRTSWKLRPLLRDAERVAATQRAKSAGTAIPIRAVEVVGGMKKRT